MDKADEATSVERLCLQLRESLRHGVRAGQLLTYSPDLIDTLCPSTESAGFGVPMSVRAMKAEEVIRKGIAEIGGNAAEALLIVLGLRSGTLDQPLQKRRQGAALMMGVQPVTFRSAHYEKQLLVNLSIEIYKIISGDGTGG